VNNIGYLSYETFVHAEKVVGVVAAQLKELDDVLHCDWCNLKRNIIGVITMLAALMLLGTNRYPLIYVNRPLVIKGRLQLLRKRTIHAAAAHCGAIATTMKREI
jgi:hypothetical protein